MNIGNVLCVEANPVPIVQPFKNNRLVDKNAVKVRAVAFSDFHPHAFQIVENELGKVSRPEQVKFFMGRNCEGRVFLVSSPAIYKLFHAVLQIRTT